MVLCRLEASRLHYSAELLKTDARFVLWACVCVSGLCSLVSFKWWSSGMYIPCHTRPHPHMWEHVSLPTIRNQTSEKSADIFLTHTKGCFTGTVQGCKESVSLDELYKQGPPVRSQVVICDHCTCKEWKRSPRMVSAAQTLCLCCPLLVKAPRTHRTEPWISLLPTPSFVYLCIFSFTITNSQVNYCC